MELISSRRIPDTCAKCERKAEFIIAIKHRWYNGAVEYYLCNYHRISIGKQLLSGI